MKRLAILILAALAAVLVACSSSAPPAPIGLDKRPANSADAIASLARPTADRTAAATVPGAPQPLAQSTDAQLASAPPGLRVMILSDKMAPRGVASLSLEQRSELLTAARSAGSIRILCRGDRARPSAAIRALLLRRGVTIKRFLVAQGIEPGKIRLFVRSAGAFIADNATASGRAQNRRVEIQFV